MFRSHIRGVVPLCLLLLAGCASAHSSLDVMAPEEHQVIRPGDLIQVVVWREEDLTGEFLVDRSGRVVLPRIGRWEVTGETEPSLEERLASALGEDLRHATVDVTVLRRIQVLGAVTTPGLYTLDSTMTLGDALAMAGGVNPTGQQDRIDIIRGNERHVIELDETRSLTGLTIRSGDSIYIPQKNWFVRNYPAVFAGLSSRAGVVALIVSLTGS